ncbi:hypothetical protein F5Y17DRAFT_396417 [Xylariaceae sp. FL0594]|nr:hypothetical protein F5Y17DRAFT_396417 [Xylariaceae sp. FL0594]
MADLSRIAIGAARPLIRRQPILSAPTSPSPLFLTYLGRSSNPQNVGGKRTRVTYSSEFRNRTSNRADKDKERMRKLEASSTFLLPLTIVPPPITRFPRSPTKFMHMLYLIARNKITRIGSAIGVYFVSMTGFSLPKFRSNRSSALPAGKLLHAQMSEAVAAGDKETLRQICARELFTTLAGAIDSRSSKGKARTEWELVKYTRRVRYPRLSDFRVSYQPLSGTTRMRLIKQAVVSISSVQRLTRFDEQGNKVPGTGQVKELLEHVVLQSEVDTNTWKSSPWKIWGNLSETAYEDIVADLALFNEVMASDARKR